MEYGAIDLHKKESQVRIIPEGGEVIDRRIPTTRNHLTTLFWGRPHARILIEASTESEWVAQHLETLGHEVVVADPNYALMYGHRSRRVKTDRRDWQRWPRRVAMAFIDQPTGDRRSSGTSNGSSMFDASWWPRALAAFPSRVRSLDMRDIASRVAPPTRFCSESPRSSSRRCSTRACRRSAMSWR